MPSAKTERAKEFYEVQRSSYSEYAKFFGNDAAEFLTGEYWVLFTEMYISTANDQILSFTDVEDLKPKDISRSTWTRYLKRAREKGYIVSSVDSHDKRGRILALADDFFQHLSDFALIAIQNYSKIA